MIKGGRVCEIGQMPDLICVCSSGHTAVSSELHTSEGSASPKSVSNVHSQVIVKGQKKTPSKSLCQL